MPRSSRCSTDLRTRRRLPCGHDACVSGGRVDHLVVGSASLDLGVAWVEERLGVTPIFGGVHDGFGTRNALVGLGDQYLEVLALDPAQREIASPLREQVRPLRVPKLLTLAVARTHLNHPVPMSRVRADGVRIEWELEFTSTPLFFINWKDTPRPSGLPDGGRITSLSVTTPDPEALRGVEGIVVREGAWQTEASIDATPLA